MPSLGDFVEYFDLSVENGELTVYCPCPGCGAYGLWVCAVKDAEKTIGNPATCRKCDRSFKILLRDSIGRFNVEALQVSGPDLPEGHHVRRLN